MFTEILNPNDTVMVHSSLSSFGHIKGGAETVVQALIKALPQGTLLMPALSYRYVSKKIPVFSAAETPSCVGAIPEAFRKTPGVVRSVHPTHSVCAYGVRAAEITAQHRSDRTPVGENSPFRLLPKYGGKIMMLGCGLAPNTFMHGVEEAAGLPYVLQSEPAKLRVEGEDVMHFMHNFEGIWQRYERAAECVSVTRGKVMDADVFIIDAAELWDAAAKKLEKEPWFFVDRLSLRKLSADDGREIYDMLQGIAENDNGFHNSVKDMPYEEFSGWLAKTAGFSESIGLEDWMVPESTFWLYDGDTPVGCGRLRHHLNDTLKKDGGHIGYAISEKFRGKGFGREILPLLLKEAGKMGIAEVHIGANKDNVWSNKIIVKCGAKLVRETDVKCHYVIDNKYIDKR